jgi:hypothetical protein
MPLTVRVALLLVTFDSDTVTTAVFFDSAWISPRALLIFTVALPPALTVTLVGESVSADASAANSTEHSITHRRNTQLTRGVA